jgi:hypothetical protein
MLLLSPFGHCSPTDLGVQTHSAAGRHCVSCCTVVQLALQLCCTPEKAEDIVFDRKKTELNSDDREGSYRCLKKGSEKRKCGPISP